MISVVHLDIGSSSRFKQLSRAVYKHYRSGTAFYINTFEDETAMVYWSVTCNLILFLAIVVCIGRGRTQGIPYGVMPPLEPFIRRHRTLTTVLNRRREQHVVGRQKCPISRIRRRLRCQNPQLVTCTVPSAFKAPQNAQMTYG